MSVCACICECMRVCVCECVYVYVTPSSTLHCLYKRSATKSGFNY